MDTDTYVTSSERHSFLDSTGLVIECDVFNGRKWEFHFENGYGASIIQHDMSCGHRQGLFELAVLKKFVRKGWQLCYDTQISKDVIGCLDDTAVKGYMEKIRALPAI